MDVLPPPLLPGPGRRPRGPRAARHVPTGGRGRQSYAEASGRNPGDLTWHIAYAAIRHGAIMRRVTERSIFFGEAEAPDDIDELIMHRATLRGILDGTYWDGRGPLITGAPRAARR